MFVTSKGKAIFSKVAKKIVEYANNEQDTIEYKELNKSLNVNMRKKDNLISAISECEETDTRQSLFDELSKIQKTLDEVNSHY